MASPSPWIYSLVYSRISLPTLVAIAPYDVPPTSRLCFHRMNEGDTVRKRDLSCGLGTEGAGITRLCLRGDGGIGDRHIAELLR